MSYEDASLRTIYLQYISSLIQCHNISISAISSMKQLRTKQKSIEPSPHSAMASLTMLEKDGSDWDRNRVTSKFCDDEE